MHRKRLRATTKSKLTYNLWLINLNWKHSIKLIVLILKLTWKLSADRSNVIANVPPKKIIGINCVKFKKLVASSSEQEAEEIWAVIQPVTAVAHICNLKLSKLLLHYVNSATHSVECCLLLFQWFIYAVLVTNGEMFQNVIVL